MTSPTTRNALTRDDRLFLDNERERVKCQLLCILDERFGTHRAFLQDAYIVVDGYRLRDVYDDAPGLACYSVDTTINFHGFAGNTLDDCRQKALWRLTEVNMNHATDPDDAAPWAGEDDGIFVATGVRVVSRHGLTIEHYQHGRWVDPIAPELWAETQKTIAGLNVAAQEERRSDSFFSARGESHEATQLQYRLEISRNRFPIAA